ncbi:MAG TPA: hypothetical protein VGO52_01875 [Hyphomonadaceae bacterium]|jgi:hypothetical protein|nr:hypothetical protein [Hyphomonadaceae bacterium]
MTETQPRRPQERVKAQLEAAHTVGSWMPWAGVALAVMLWGAALILMFAGGPAVLSAPPAVLAAGVGVLLASGIAMICAGVMARETSRSAEANRIVLQSARLLLEPAQTAREEITSIAAAVTTETQNVNRALADTRSKLDGLRKELESSVTMALKAAEVVRADSEVLVHKMSSERQSMAQLAESLRNQSESIAKAVPRHAQMLSEAAKAAQDQVRKADETLNARLRSLDETAGHLGSRIDQLDTMGAESRKRAQNLAGALMRLDEQLVQSTRMVEAATKAGELATAATKSTAESLRDAVSDAIGGALKATEQVTASSARASEDARIAMAQLKETGLQVEATTRSAAIAAKNQADETEARVRRLMQVVLSEGSKAGHVAETDLVDRARQRIEKASKLIGKMKSDDQPKPIKQPSIDDMILDPPAFELRAEPTQQPLQRASAPDGRNGNGQADREPLFARDAGRQADPLFAAPQTEDDFLLDKPVNGRAQRPAASANYDAPRDPTADDLVLNNNVTQLRGRSAQPILPETRPPPQAFDPLFPPERVSNGGNGAPWRDLLNTVEEVPEQRRAASAGSMIDRLDRAGVRLGGMVTAQDLRRIASAASQGDRYRRKATRDVAPGEIQRVARLLETDRDWQMAARSFVSAEEADALRVLAVSERAREDAHPRLSAYLLLDAALGGPNL